jgi:hypothetical protein
LAYLCPQVRKGCGGLRGRGEGKPLKGTMKYGEARLLEVNYR